MEVLYLIVPLAVGFAAVAVGLFIWAVQSGQYDDLTTPAHQVLLDDE